MKAQPRAKEKWNAAERHSLFVQAHPEKLDQVMPLGACPYCAKAIAYMRAQCSHFDPSD